MALFAHDLFDSLKHGETLVLARGWQLEVTEASFCITANHVRERTPNVNPDTQHEIHPPRTAQHMLFDHKQHIAYRYVNIDY